MSIPLCLNITGYVNGFIDRSAFTDPNSSYYGYTVQLINPQVFGAGQYTLDNIRIGMYISTDSIDLGQLYQIVSIVRSSPNPITFIQPTNLINPGFYTNIDPTNNAGDFYADPGGGGFIVDLIIKDIYNYNNTVNVFGGGPNDNVNGYIYEVNSNNLPIFLNLAAVPTTSFTSTQLSRFLTTYRHDGATIDIIQVGFNVKAGDIIRVNTSGIYSVVNNSTNTISDAIGIVTSVNSLISLFTYCPFGIYYENISRSFIDSISASNNLDLTNPSVVGPGTVTNGTFIYINGNTAGGQPPYTLTPNGNPIWLFLGINPEINTQRAILFPYGNGGGGGGGGGGNLIYDDTYFTKNLSNSAPIVPFSNVLQTTTSIYIPWNYPTQFPIGMMSTWIPVISTLTCKLTFEYKPNTLSTLYLIKDQASTFVNFNNGIPSTFITGVVLTNIQAVPSTFISTMKFPGDTFDRNALIYGDPVVSSISKTLGSNTFSAWYMNWNPISTVSTVSFLGYAVAGSPSQVTNLVPGVATSSNISINVTPPTSIDSTDPATSLTIASYTANFSTIGSATRFGGPLVNSSSNSSLTLPINISGLFPGSTYNFNVFATNSGGGESSNSSNGTFTTPNPPAGTLVAGALSFPPRYFTGVNKVSTNAPVTKLVDSITNWSSTPFRTPIHATGNAGSTGSGLMTLTTSLTSNTVITGPSITFDGFPATSPLSNTANNITIEPSVIDEYSSRGPEFQGFYLTSENTVTIDSSLFAPYSSDIVLTGTVTNSSGANSASFTYQYDTILSTPPTIASITITPPSLTIATQVSGVFLLPNVPTYTIAVSMGNIGNFYYSSKFLEYTITPTGSTIDEGSSLSNITAGCNAGALAPSGVICTNNSVTTGSVATFYLSNVTAKATVYNTFGSNSLTTIKAVMIDGPSLVLKATLQSFPTLVIGSFSTGGHVSSQAWSATNNVPAYPGPGTVPYNHATSLTVGDASLTYELQISNGRFTASSNATGLAYIDYTTMHDNNINYSALASGGGYRYATFAWNLPAAPFGQIILTVNGATFSDVLASATDSTGSNIHLSYRLEETASKIPTNATNNSTAWLNGNAAEQAANIAGDYYTSSYWGGRRSFSGGNTFNVILPLVDCTGRPGVLYVRIGLSRLCTNTFTGISAKLTL